MFWKFFVSGMIAKKGLLQRSLRHSDLSSAHFAHTAIVKRQDVPKSSRVPSSYLVRSIKSDLFDSVYS
jgi:hypothetical protein